jgi:L-rhamnose mutarotase
VGYLEAVPSKAVAFEKLSHYEVNGKWAKWFEEVIVNLTDGKGNLLELKEIWRLEE